MMPGEPIAWWVNRDGAVIVAGQHIGVAGEAYGRLPVADIDVQGLTGLQGPPLGQAVPFAQGRDADLVSPRDVP